ncbi:hypothetical protein [Spongiactinospora sp. 9N601]|uniref:hypothetical protein n=1 Tax=Spongiactinospora sp. 9N601 TaxID=3375149 RepID=UPI0037B66869
MNAAAKLGVYAAGLVVVFGGALGLGGLAGPGAPPPAKTHTDTHAGEDASEPAGEHTHEQEDESSGDTPGGLQVSEKGFTLTPVSTALKAGEATDFRFTVTGADGRPVTEFDVNHDKKMHFIVVSRDLTEFQHLHPVQKGGEWSIPLTLPKGGSYRAFADFVPSGYLGMTLGIDVGAAGDYAPAPLPAASRTAQVDGYTVTLDGELTPGLASKLTLRVEKDGKPVTDLERYLGAYGHLVALRAGDLAYLHVHPEESGAAGPEIAFYAEVPSTGDYRLFLDFQHKGKVRTADFTVRAAPGAGAKSPKPKESAESPGHGH